MSIEQPLDNQLIEQTKQQIRGLVAEIAQLSKTDVAPEVFFSEFLSRVVSALAAVGGAVWTVNPEGQLALQYQINLQETKLRDNEERQAQHGRLLYKALASGEGMLVPPHSGPGDAGPLDQEAPAANPTDFLLVLGLLKTDLETAGVVKVFQRAEAGPNTQKGYLRFLMQMCELAGDFLKSHQLRHFSHRQTLWTQLEDFTRGVHASLDPRDTAYTIANEGRRLIECDRVSVAIRKGKKCFVEAVSGQDVFDKRSNTVRLLGKLATAVVASGDPVWYTGDTRDLPPQVEDAVQEYVDEAHSKTVAVLPLRRPAPPEQDDPNKRTEPEPPIGALIVEQIEDSRMASSLVQRAEVVGRHSSLALANALEHQNLFLMPVWRALGKTRWVVQSRTLPKTLTIAGSVLVLLLILVLWPVRFTLESKGTLQPVLRRNVFAAVGGQVEEIPKEIDHGRLVKKGQRLLLLRSTEVELGMSDVQGKLDTNNERLVGTRRLLAATSKLSMEDQNKLKGQAAELMQNQKTLQQELELYRNKQKELDVTSPIDGLVVTWQPRYLLSGRTVQPGTRVLELADPSGPWQLELHMPDNHIGPIVKAQQALYGASREKLRDLLRAEIRGRSGDAAAEEEVEKAVETALDEVPDEQLHDRILAAAPNEELDDRLPVTFVLASESGTTCHGTVTEIARTAEVHGDEGNTFLIKVAIDKSELPDQSLGETVTAKVYCGRRSLGYVLFQDVIAFFQSRIWFRYGPFQ